MSVTPRDFTNASRTRQMVTLTLSPEARAELDRRAADHPRGRSGVVDDWLTGRDADAIPFADATIARRLKDARLFAGLTQEQLAAKVGKSQSVVSQIERCIAGASEQYIAAVLKACGLPKDWKPE